MSQQRDRNYIAHALQFYLDRTSPMNNKFGHRTEYERLLQEYRDEPCDYPQGATCGQRWVAEIELCPRCGQNAAAHHAAPAKYVRLPQRCQQPARKGGAGPGYTTCGTPLNARGECENASSHIKL